LLNFDNKVKTKNTTQRLNFSKSIRQIVERAKIDLLETKKKKKKKKKTKTKTKQNKTKQSKAKHTQAKTKITS
jgi:hypothetical protein